MFIACLSILLLVMTYLHHECSASEVVSRVIQNKNTSNRKDRMWPYGHANPEEIKLAFAAPYGPRTNSSGYDFHPGLDIYLKHGTPLYTIDDGKVINDGDSSGIVIIKHTDWENDVNYYSRYKYVAHSGSHIRKANTVARGDQIGVSGGSIKFPHIHFEIRYKKNLLAYSCNPFKYLPFEKSPMFTANMTVIPNPGGMSCMAAVKVSVPPDQMTLNSIRLISKGGVSMYDNDFKMCEDWLHYSKAGGKTDYGRLDDPTYIDHVSIWAAAYSSHAYRKGEWMDYKFTFKGLPPVAAGKTGTVHAIVTDVYDNELSAVPVEYGCP